MKVQSDVYTIVLNTILIAIAIVWLSKKIEKANPLEKPKGIMVFVLWAMGVIHKSVSENVGTKNADHFTPYIAVLWLYIFFSNVCSLFGLSSPTANFSVTLLLAILTWILQQVTIFRYQGAGSWFHAFIEPLPVMLPMNIFGKFSSLVSMSLRLFGNIICGSVMMSLVYAFAQYLSNSIAGLLFGANGDVFNFIAPILTPLLHAYFDLFAGFIQTLIFVTLTTVFVGNEIPDEIKKA